MSPNPAFDTVVIAGGSIAGLLAAAAATPHARRVVVIERDALPDSPAYRSGTPHAAHTHGLLASGRGAMEQLLPGFTERLQELGGISGADTGSAGRWWIGGGLIGDCTLGTTGVAASRPAVEHVLRELVTDLPTVEMLDSIDLVSLSGSADRVDGVVVRRHATDEHPWVIRTDLVVDATGRSGRGWRWLSGLGATVPVQERTVIGLHYATFHLQAADTDLGGRVVVVSAATPECPRGGVALRQEGGTWSVTLFAYGEEKPPVDLDGIRQFAGSIVSPDLTELLTQRVPLDTPRTYRFPDCRRRHVERGILPRGFTAIGDSICSFDPTFGQGMSVAALEAVALRNAMAGGVTAVQNDYPRAASRIVDGAWTVVHGSVLQLPTTAGQPPRGQRVVNRYLRHLQRIARHDPDVARAFLRVTNLLAEPRSLLAPAITIRVLRRAQFSAISPRTSHHATASPTLAPRIYRLARRRQSVRELLIGRKT